jgi:hypothetical protein
VFFLVIKRSRFTPIQNKWRSCFAYPGGKSKTMVWRTLLNHLTTIRLNTQPFKFISSKFNILNGPARSGRDADRSPHLVPRSIMRRSYGFSPPWRPHGIAAQFYVTSVLVHNFLSSYVSRTFLKSLDIFSRNLIHGTSVHLLGWCGFYSLLFQSAYS